LSWNLWIRAQEPAPDNAEIQEAAEIPKGYAIFEKSVSPNGRFAILTPAV
jgi:hypothetical protein